MCIRRAAHYERPDGTWLGVVATSFQARQQLRHWLICKLAWLAEKRLHKDSPAYCFDEFQSLGLRGQPLLELAKGFFECRE